MFQNTPSAKTGLYNCAQCTSRNIEVRGTNNIYTRKNIQRDETHLSFHFNYFSIFCVGPEILFVSRVLSMVGTEFTQFFFLSIFFCAIHCIAAAPAHIGRCLLEKWNTQSVVLPYTRRRRRRRIRCADETTHTSHTQTSTLFSRPFSSLARRWFFYFLSAVFFSLSLSHVALIFYPDSRIPCGMNGGWVASE